MRDVALYFHAMDDRKRLSIVLYLAQHKEVRVTDLGTELRLSQPLISWHLRLLRRAGIVSTRRVGRQVWCSLNRRALQQYEQRVDQILGLGGNSSEEGGDRQPLSLEPARGR